MSNHVTMIEKAFHAANTALGTDPKYPKPLASAFERRDAAAELVDYRPMNVAQELAAAPDPRKWSSILDQCAAHNARARAAQDAIKGGILTSATAQLDHALKAYVPEYTSTTYKTVEAHLNALTEAAQACPTLNADSAVKGGYGDAMTRFYQHAQIIVTYTGVGTITAPADRAAQAARALSLVVAPEPINPIKRTQPTRWSAPGGELKSGPEDVARRDATHNLLTAWVRDEVDTLRRLARHEFAGFELSAATAEDYDWRVTQFANSQRTVHVDD